MSLKDYTLEEEIGRGAFGRVFRARHAATGAVRAVKVVDAAGAGIELTARFEREARALGVLGGEGVVPVHEAGSDRGRHYLVMGFMPGGSLRDRMKKAGKLPWREAASVALELARALARCHEAGIVHRDLKPENVLFDDTGRPRLADFGMVRDLRALSLTETGTVLGTPLYMAPEQLDGAKVDERADVYAVGVILHELIAGARPFTDARSLLSLLSEKRKKGRPLLGVPGTPAELDLLLDRAVAPRPDDRTASAAALARELEALASRPEPRRRAAAGALALVAAAALAAFAAVTRATGPGGPFPTAGSATVRGPLGAAGRQALLEAVSRKWLACEFIAAVDTCVAMARATEDPWVEALLADALLEAGDVEGALHLVEEWPAGKAGEERALSIRAFVHASRRDRDAHEDAERAARDPSLARAWLVKSMLEFDDALAPENSSRSASLLENAARHAKRAGQLRAPCQWLASIAEQRARAKVAMYGGKPDAALIVIETVLDPYGGAGRRVPVDSDPAWAEAKGEVAFLHAGISHYLKGDHGAAAEDALAAIHLNPKRPFAHALLARCRPSVLAEEMERALALDKWEPLGIEWLAGKHVKDGNFPAALEIVEKRIRIYPEGGGALTRARLLVAMHELAKAAAALDALDVHDPYKKRRVALVALHAGANDRAKELARDAVLQAEAKEDWTQWGLSIVVESRILHDTRDFGGARRDEVSSERTDKFTAARRAAVARAFLAEGETDQATGNLVAACKADRPFNDECVRQGIPVDPFAAAPGRGLEIGDVRKALDLELAPDTVLVLHEWTKDWPILFDMPP